MTQLKNEPSVLACNINGIQHKIVVYKGIPFYLNSNSIFVPHKGINKSQENICFERFSDTLSETHFKREITNIWDSNALKNLRKNSDQEDENDLYDLLLSFGTMEALLISMKISPTWGAHVDLQQVKNAVLANSEYKRFYDGLDDNLLDYSTVEINNIKDLYSLGGGETDSASPAVLNQRIQLECEKTGAGYTIPKFSYQKPSLLTAGLSFGTAVLTGVSGGLILGYGSLFSITAGSAFLGLNIAAAATGFGLVAIAAVAAVVCLVALYQYYKKRQCVRDPGREDIAEFLKANTADSGKGVELQKVGKQDLRQTNPSTVPPVSLGKNSSTMYGQTSAGWAAWDAAQTNLLSTSATPT